MPNYKEIARLKAAGKSNRAIADFLGLSRNTGKDIANPHVFLKVMLNCQKLTILRNAR